MEFEFWNSRSEKFAIFDRGETVGISRTTCCEQKKNFFAYLDHFLQVTTEQKSAIKLQMASKYFMERKFSRCFEIHTELKTGRFSYTFLKKQLLEKNQKSIPNNNHYFNRPLDF